ncbi:MAG TPA: lysylphosphatidylglycerol synthase transmembrane domain-containing protein [Gaiellaceae bacterium]|nr:lysylphosphatidylglycerol synthase transmembrane domain-containing protein [Gaiellaceae bacterium]
MSRWRPRVPRSPWTRAVIVLLFLAGVGALLWWHGPHWADFRDAFTAVRWEWVAAAVGFNLLSIVARAFAWDTVIRTAMPEPHPRFQLVFASFCVGLLANAVLPGRVGELARVAVLSRRLNGRRPGLWSTLVGTVFAHRVFDLVPVVILVAFVLATADIPGWAFTSLVIVLSLGVALFLFAFASARHHQKTRIDGMGSARRIVTMARLGLGVMRSPGAAALAILGQCAGWTLQLVAVWSAMRAFDIHEGLSAAAVVLLLMNVATIIPLWPGNVGLVQVAVATPLVRYGVDYGRGVAFGFGLQAIEASVGVGIGLVFLGREGLSFARLREMPGAVSADDEGGERSRDEAAKREPGGARVPG